MSPKFPLPVIEAGGVRRFTRLFDLVLYDAGVDSHADIACYSSIVTPCSTALPVKFAITGFNAVLPKE